MLVLKNLQYAYEGTRFDFSMQVEQGSFLAIIGPSGAGKSTLLDIIAGFIAPTSGGVSFDQKKLTNLPVANRPISMMFQENNLFTHLDVQTNVALGLSPNLKLSVKQTQEVIAALDRVGLKGFEKRLPGELSGGERQRVALARVLVRDKPLLLLDEPFAALGPALRAQMLKLVKELHTEKSLTTILVSHQPEDAKTTATHTAFLNNGIIELYKETDKLFATRNNTNLNDYISYQGSS